MSKLVSGRVKRKTQTGITSDRYQFLGLEQAEPNLGDPTVGPSSTGANPVKVGTIYQVVGIDQYPGERFWSPVSGIGTSVGAITVYNNGEIVTPNFFNTIHGLNFTGIGVTVTGPGVAGPFPGVGIATIDIGYIELQNQGEPNQILFNTPTGTVDGAPEFYYLNDNVGIGSTIPKVKLDIIGDANFTGVVTATSFYGNLFGNATYANSSGFSTISGYSTASGVSTSVIGGIASISHLIVSGISTLGILTAQSGFISTLTGNNAVFSGIVTAQFVDGIFIGQALNAVNAQNVIGGIASVSQLNVTGISTLPIINGGSANFTGIITAQSFSGTATTALNAVQLQTARTINVIGPDFNSIGKSFNGTQNIDIDLALKIQSGVSSSVYGAGNQIPIIGVNSSGVVTSVTTITLAGINSSGIVEKSLYANVAGIATYAISAGISTYANFAGIATFANISGVATNVIGGIASVSSLNVNGISTLGTVRISSGIVSATTGIVTYYGDGSKLSNVTNVGGIGSFTQLTVSGISTLGNVKVGAGIITASVGVVTYYGDGSKLIGFELTYIPDEYSIVYVDGGVTLDPDGLANVSGISSFIWKDIHTNRTTHKILTWTNGSTGSAPPNGSAQEFLARRVVFPNIKAAFDSFVNQNSRTRRRLDIYLYTSSDSNGGSSVTCFYGGNDEIYISKGPSQSILSGKPWGPEHYSGLIQVPSAKIFVLRANLNINGNASNPNRYAANNTGLLVSSAYVINSRFKLNTNSNTSTGFIIFNSTASSTSDVVNGDVTLFIEDSSPSEIEFDIDILQPISSTNVSYPSLAIVTGKLLIWTRRENQLNRFTLTYKNKRVFQPAFTAAGANPGFGFCEIRGSQGAEIIIDGGAPVGSNARYGDTDFVLDFTGSNAIGPFIWIRHNIQSRPIIILDKNPLYLSGRSDHNFNIVGINSVNIFVGMVAGQPINFTGSTRVSAGSSVIDTTNFLSRMKSAFTTAGITSANSYAWTLPAGSWRDGQIDSLTNNDIG